MVWLRQSWLRDNIGHLMAGSVSIFDGLESIWIVVADPNEEGREVCVMSSHHEDHSIVIKPMTLADDAPDKSVYDLKRNKEFPSFLLFFLELAIHKKPL